MSSPNSAPSLLAIAGKPVYMGRLDAEKNRGWANSHEVRCYPTVFIFYKGAHLKIPGANKEESDRIEGVSQENVDRIWAILNTLSDMCEPGSETPAPETEEVT